MSQVLILQSDPEVQAFFQQYRSAINSKAFVTDVISCIKPTVCIWQAQRGLDPGIDVPVSTRGLHYLEPPCNGTGACPHCTSS